MPGIFERVERQVLTPKPTPLRYHGPGAGLGGGALTRFAGALFGVAAGLAMLLPACAAEQQDLEDLVRRSPFIFRGTVTKLRTATMAIVPVLEGTIAVRIDEVIRGPALFGHYAGKEITVRIAGTEAPKVGEQLTFFATGWLLGESLALQENARLREADLAGLSVRVAAAAQRLADQELRNRIAGADLMVVGRVSRIIALTRPHRSGPRGEHDPEWRKAVVDADAILKGAATGRRVEVLFPGSEDVAWFHAPKFGTGQEGIWMLRWDRRLRAYTALDSLDFQPRTELERVKTLRAAGGRSAVGAKGLER